MTHRTYISLDDFPTKYTDINYRPENADEDDAPYTWEDFCAEALGNLTYAEQLAEGVSWQHVSTLVDEDLREGYIRYSSEAGTFDIYDEGDKPLPAVYDKAFFVANNYLLAG